MPQCRLEYIHSDRGKYLTKLRVRKFRFLKKLAEEKRSIGCSGNTRLLGIKSSKYYDYKPNSIEGFLSDLQTAAIVEIKA